MNAPHKYHRTLARPSGHIFRSHNHQPNNNNNVVCSMLTTHEIRVIPLLFTQYSLPGYILIRNEMSNECNDLHRNKINDRTYKWTLWQLIFLLSFRLSLNPRHRKQLLKLASTMPIPLMKRPVSWSSSSVLTSVREHSRYA